jgi:uncharacterized small protein (DUF1192 family)
LTEAEDEADASAASVDVLQAKIAHMRAEMHRLRAENAALRAAQEEHDTSLTGMLRLRDDNMALRQEVAALKLEVERRRVREERAEQATQNLADDIVAAELTAPTPLPAYDAMLLRERRCELALAAAARRERRRRLLDCW